MNDLAAHIQATTLIDTHEHLGLPGNAAQQHPDVLVDLFDNYVRHDLEVAGASRSAIERLFDTTDPDIAGRFTGIRDAWERCRHTGYGEAAGLIAEHVHGIPEFGTPELERAQQALVSAGPLPDLQKLRDRAGLDHVQIDDFEWACRPNLDGPDFFLSDLSWASFARGEVEPEARFVFDEVGIQIETIATLDDAMAALFAKYAPCAIAVKSQHAYARTLRWQERERDDVAAVLDKQLRGTPISDAERLCLGDWALARGVELAAEYNLPIKIHTGYYAGTRYMPLERIAAGQLSPLIARYPGARFVLMHMAYPYSDELVALAKHYPNVYVDLCWGWSIDPFSAVQFVRRMIHAVPTHKLFAFGGDAWRASASLAYAIQARRWLTRTLQAEVDEGLLAERQAIALATRMMQTNQRECFDIEGTRGAIEAAMTDVLRDARSHEG